MGAPPAWGLDVGLTTPHRKNKLVTKILKKPLTGRTPWLNDISERKWIWDLVLGMLEVCIGQGH
jgi:hypothetical protein